MAKEKDLPAANRTVKDRLHILLAFAGATLVWVPIVAPFFFAFARLVQGGSFLFDYLMPAEFFPLVFAGGMLLFITARLARTKNRLIDWGLALAAVSLAACQGFAVVKGMASGAAELAAWMWAQVFGALAVYCAAVLAIGMGGVQLIRDLKA